MFLKLYVMHVCFLVVNLSKSVSILFRPLPNGNCQFSPQSSSLAGENWLVHELIVIVANKPHLNTRYYAQHRALKSVYEKSQSLMGGKLFYSYRTVFELVQSLWDSKTIVSCSNDLNCSYEELVQKEHWPNVMIGYLYHFDLFYH